MLYLTQGRNQGCLEVQGALVFFKEDSSRHMNCTCKCLQNGPKTHHRALAGIWSQERKQGTESTALGRPAAAEALTALPTVPGHLLPLAWI